MKGFELILGMFIGFAFGGFIYCLAFDEREHIKIVSCDECIFYHSLGVDGICELYRVTADGQEVNVFTQECDYCPYGERREECKSEIDLPFIRHILQGVEKCKDE